MTSASDAQARRRRLLAVAVGGAVGATVRVLVAETGDAGLLPWGTLAVNLVGAFLLGIVLVRLQRRPTVRALVGTGVLGSLTTFSGLMIQTAEIGRQHPTLGVGYLGLSVSAGLVLAFAGDRLARRVPAAERPGGGGR